MKNLIKIVAAFLLAALLPCSAFAQAAGQLQSGQIWGNPKAAQAPGTGTTVGAILDRQLACNAQGDIIFRGATLWGCLPPGTAGLPLVSGGTGANLQYSQLANAALVNSSTTVNGVTCTLGASCAITATAASMTVGTTTIVSGTTSRVLFDNGGTLGEYPLTGTGNVVMSASPTLTGTMAAAAGTFAGNVAITSASASALAVGLNGATNPVLLIDASIASQATGILIRGFAAGGGVALTATSSATNENLAINAKGTGLISIGNVSTGSVTIGPPTTLSGALTYGGVTLTNSVTGTGSMVLATAPTISSLAVTTAFTATGLVTNADLVNPSVTVSGVTCTLGSTCSPPTSSIIVGTTIVTTGTSGRVLFDNGSIVGEYAISGTGSVAMTTSPAFTTPTLGVATSSSEAIGGCTIGTNALCAAGTVAFSSTLTSGAQTITSASANAVSVGLSGATNPAFQVDASTASQATGIKITGFAAGGGTAIGSISSAANENLVINAKGTGQVVLGNVSTGGISIPNGLTVGNVFSATGLVTYADMASAAVANQSQYFSGAASTLVPASVVYSAETVTTFAAAATFDFSTFINTAMTLTANITSMTLNNVKAGQAGQIRFIQDATGSRTTVWNSIFKFPGGVVPSLSTTANAVDALEYNCISATYCVASLVLNVK